jgi:uncharacterized protein YprB with RNaseH-like and TPR domain
MSDLRERLDQLKATNARAAIAIRARRLHQPARLVDVVGGSELTLDRHACWRIDTPFKRVCPTHAAGGRALPRALAQLTSGSAGVTLDPRHTVLLDIETGGFAGHPVFLIGIVLLDRRPLRVIQWLARDYPEEESILRALARELCGRDTWITFNGKSFDEPFLRDRAVLHGVPLGPAQHHLDLLHAARRRWKATLPDCRLTTLERHVLKRPRFGDVPSSDVPALFRFFIETGNAGPIRPVLEHNQLDLVSCTELLVHLAAPD